MADLAVDNAASFLIDQPLAEGLGSRPAVVTPEKSWTYGELRSLTDRTAHGLRRLGVEPEQRVGLLMPDGIEFVATFFALLKVGAVAVPLNTRAAARDVAVILGDCRAKVLVADRTLSVPLGPVEAPRAVEFESLLDGSAEGPVTPEPVGQDAMAFWLYTSGTTGTPKAAVHCHRTLLAGHHYGADVAGIGPADRVFATSRLFFAYALGNALVLPLSARASCYLHPAWPEASVVLDVLKSYRPTLYFSVPTVYARLLRGGLPADAFRSVRLCISAGERLPAEVYHAWKERFGVEILDGIGATETVFMFVSNRAGRCRPGSTGTPVSGSEIKLLDAAGQPVADGEQGVLWAKTPSTAAGYWKRLDHSRRTFVGDWFRTGDVYVRDADGYLTHCGREDDFFKVAGQWVAPADVEAALMKHPGVLEAGVVGAAEPSGLIKPFVFIVPRDAAVEAAALQAELMRHAERLLPSHQRPREIRIVAELPRTATGKLQRFKLKEYVGPHA
ncbi:MAG TPA: benzoate-CoA ligase family protein [Methylomirabilota bacterium]